jgi:hypothetical protein
VIDVCHNPNNPEYKYFGAIGVKVCDEWLNSYSNFLQDMSPTPDQNNDNFFIERIDSTQHYCKANCKWTILPSKKELFLKKYKIKPIDVSPLNLENPIPINVSPFSLEDPSACQSTSARRNALCP